MPLSSRPATPPPLRPGSGWDSDLTDLESEDELEQEEIEPPPTSSQRDQHARPQPAEDRSAHSQPSSSRHGRTTRQATQKAADEDLGGLRDCDQGVLPPYIQTPTKVSDAYEWMTERLVNVCPDYQRDVVWNETKQMNLIDSLFQNYPVPNLVFVRWYEDGDWRRVCIDGKQRLTSIRRFIDGEIPWKDPTTKKKLWYQKTDPKQRRTLLPEKLKKTFMRKGLTVYDYEGLTQNQERMIFQRVQLGTVLTPAERLQAVNGITATVVRDIRVHVCALNVFAAFSEWGGNRGRDFLALAQIVFVVKAGKLPSTQALPEPDKLTPFLEGKVGGDIDKLRDGIKHSFSIFARLLSHPIHGRSLSEKEISPVEFVVGVYAISTLKEKLTDSDLADALKKIWNNARDKSNGKKKATKSSASQSYVAMRAFFERVRDGRVMLEGDKSETVKAAHVIWDPTLKANPAPESHTDEEPQSTSRKRPRPAADNDSDGEASSKTKTARKAPVSKKPKIAHRTKCEPTPNPDDNDEAMASDDSAEIVDFIPKRSIVSGSAVRRPIGARPGASAAATRVKGAPTSNTKREAASTSTSARASTSAAPLPRSAPKPNASRSSSIQSSSVANTRNNPASSSIPPGRVSQPRSANATPSTSSIPLPPESSHPAVGAGTGNTNPRMERLHTLQQLSKPGSSSSATPPSQYPPQFSPITKLPTPPKESPAPEESTYRDGERTQASISRVPHQSVAQPRFPPGQLASTFTSASASTIPAATASADSVLDTLRAKGGNLTGLRFSKTPSLTEVPTAKIELPTPPLPSRVPDGLASAPPLPSRHPADRQQPQQQSGSAGSGFPFGLPMVALGRKKAESRVWPTPPVSSSNSKDVV